MKFISENAASKATSNKVIEYVLDEEKVCRDKNGKILMATIGLDDERPYAEQFRETALLYGNAYGADERKYYHLKYTASPRDYDPESGVKNISPEQLLEKTLQFCHDNLSGYQSLVVIQYHDNSKSTYNLDPSVGRWTEERIPNEKHLHAHIITNACPYDFERGMLRLRNKDLDAMRDYAYEAGKKYHLHERNWRDEVTEKRARQKAEREAKKAANKESEGIKLSAGEKVIIDKHSAGFATKSFKEKYRIAIDEARREVTTFDMFTAYLKSEFAIKTEVTQQGNIKFKLPDRTTYTSGKVLGADYTLDAIMVSLEQSKKDHKDDFTSVKEAVGAYASDKMHPSPSTAAVKWRNQVMDELEKFHLWEKEMQGSDPEWNEKKRDPNKQVEQMRLVLEKTWEFYLLCQEAANNEDLKATLTEQEKENIAELQYYLETLRRQKEKQEKAIYMEYYIRQYPRRNPNYIGLYDEHGFKRTLLELIVILVAQIIKDKVKLKEIDYEDLADQPIHAYVDYELQAMVDSVRFYQKWGVGSLAEFDIKVREEGKKFGAVKKEYFAEKREREKVIEAAVKEIDADGSLTNDDRSRKIEELRNAENLILKRMEKKYRLAKKRYAACAGASESLHRQSGHVIYRTEDNERNQEKTMEGAEGITSWGSQKKAPQEDRPRRSKAEARRVQEKQYQDIRDWSDLAMDAIASKPDLGEIGNLREWAAEMEKHGCTVRITKGTISVKHPDSSNPVRLNRLGGAYEKEYIINGISNTKQEFRNRVDEGRRRAETERTASENRAYGEAARRTAASLGDDPGAGRHDCGIEITERIAKVGKERINRASRYPQTAFGER